MDKRQTLQSELEAILGSRNVYYQPPANLKMQYPAIRYKKQKIISKKADNKKYLKKILHISSMIIKSDSVLCCLL